MKNYFENETTILPFDKVLSIHKNKDSLYICIGFDKGNGIGSNFPLDQLANYKAWLDSQSNHSETPTSSSCSEKANDSNHIEDKLEMVSNHPKNSALKMIKEMQVTKQSNGTEIPQVKWLIECWEAVYGREFDKLTDDEVTIDFLEDFLHDCLDILDYAGALNNINKGNLGNHLPDVGKMVLNKEQVTMVYREINYPNLCAVCINFNDESDSKACMKCDENSSEFKVSDFYVKKFNYLINEV